MAAPGEIKYRPDGRWITYLHSPERSLVRQLYAFDLETGERMLLVEPPGGGMTDKNVSLEEALRRERQRQREEGITAYFWGPGNRLLIPARDGLYGGRAGETLQTVALRKLADAAGGPCLDARFSPDGRWVAFVQNGEVMAVPFEGGAARRVTFGAREQGMTHGLADYIAQEEMHRFTGFWWSPDSKRILFEEADERHIPIYRIVHQGKDLVGEAAQEDHHYPFAGAENPRVRLGVASIGGGEPTWLELGPESDIYLARAGWLPDGRAWAQIENRAQTRLELRVYAPDGQGEALLVEEGQPWLNLHDMFRPLKDGRFIWASERSGFMHLYLYGASGELIRPLTYGEWMVDSLDSVDEAGGRVFFSTTKEDPRQRHAYWVSLDGGEPQRLTWQPGTHAVTVAPDGRSFVDVWHSIIQTPQVIVRQSAAGADFSHADGETLFAEDDRRVEELGLEPPELVGLRNRHGDMLYGAIYRPPAQFGSGPFPVLVDVYGGPHHQAVANSWLLTAAMRRQYLRRLGFLVFVLDNRGSSRRGLAFEAHLNRKMGFPEVEDQVDGVRWLAQQGLADPDRVGVYGWSYGGYMALMCLLRAPETFRAAVAGAPVTHWDGYDTHYTERYMGRPQDEAQAYRNSSVMAHMDGLRGRLMIVHGLIDENVHFRHTARLINALIAARKPYDLLLFPDERHMPRKEGDRVYMEERIRDFFLDL
jgi:dipeptidyl-peptidase-4